MPSSNRSRPSGRVRSYEEALQALQAVGDDQPMGEIFPEFLDSPPGPNETLEPLGDDRAHGFFDAPPGIPNTSVRAFPVDDPPVVAEFAAYVVLDRKGGHLVRHTAGEPIWLAARINLVWIVFGAIARAQDDGLVIESLTVAPRYRDAEPTSESALGVTGEVLRALSPPTLLREVVEHLRRQATFVGWAEEASKVKLTVPPAQKRAMVGVQGGRVRPARVPDDEIARLAAAYVSLYRLGERRPTRRLAELFGLTSTQVRDRIHRARHELGYLTVGKQGRAGAEPTPKLLAIQQPLETPTPDEPKTAKPKARRTSRRKEQG